MILKIVFWAHNHQNCSRTFVSLTSCPAASVAKHNVFALKSAGNIFVLACMAAVERAKHSGVHLATFLWYFSMIAANAASRWR
jgi:hypothetical protein